MMDATRRYAAALETLASIDAALRALERITSSDSALRNEHLWRSAAEVESALRRYREEVSRYRTAAVRDLEEVAP